MSHAGFQQRDALHLLRLLRAAVPLQHDRRRLLMVGAGPGAARATASASCWPGRGRHRCRKCPPRSPRAPGGCPPCPAHVTEHTGDPCVTSRTARVMAPSVSKPCGTAAGSAVERSDRTAELARCLGPSTGQCTPPLREVTTNGPRVAWPWQTDLRAVVLPAGGLLRAVQHGGLRGADSHGGSCAKVLSEFSPTQGPWARRDLRESTQSSAAQAACRRWLTRWQLWAAAQVGQWR